MNQKQNIIDIITFSNGTLYQNMQEDEIQREQRDKIQKRVYKILLSLVMLFFIWNIQNLARDEYAKTHLQTAPSYRSFYNDIKRTKRIQQRLVNIPIDLSAASNLTSLISQGGVSSAQFAMEMSAPGIDSGQEYSSTNLRTENVLEANDIATDGNYLYYVTTYDETSGTDNKIVISKIGGTKQTFMSEIELSKFTSSVDCEYDSSQIYVQKDTLCIVGTSETNYDTPQAIALFYDISNKKAPILKKKVTQSGIYLTSRIKDGILYVLSQMCLDEFDTLNEENWIPRVNGQKISQKNIYMQHGLYAPGMTVLSAIDFTNNVKVTDKVAVRGNDTEVYVSSQNVYLLNSLLPRINDSTNKTGITKLQYKNGKILGKAHNIVNGSLQDAFAIDEYKGNLRLFLNVNHYTASFQTHKDKDSLFGYTFTYYSKRKRMFYGAADSTDNVVYLLDHNLNELGSINHLAKDEQIYSARMCGDYGYFVTYRETDPLFCVDISNEKNLKVLDSIKLPGYSDYLHNYTDSLLLGLGFIDEEDESGLKLSMYDTSNHGKLKEQHNVYVEDVYTSAFENYKELYIEPDQNLFGFELNDSNTEYMLYQYDSEKGFVNLLALDKKDTWSSINVTKARGVRIGSYFYIILLGDCCDSQIKCYNLDSLR